MGVGGKGVGVALGTGVGEGVGVGVGITVAVGVERRGVAICDDVGCVEVTGDTILVARKVGTGVDV